MRWRNVYPDPSKFRDCEKQYLIFAQRHGGAWVITPGKDKYYLGLRLYELGNKAAEQYDIKKIALPILEEIRDNTGLTCHLGVLEGDAPIYLLKVESPQAIVIRSWEGKRLSLHSSGLGRC